MSQEFAHCYDCLTPLECSTRGCWDRPIARATKAPTREEQLRTEVATLREALLLARADMRAAIRFIDAELRASDDRCPNDPS